MEPVDNPVETQLADLLESYPSASTANFQTILSAKKEFAELKLDPIEKLPKGRGKFYKHQKFTHRYLRAYDSLVITSQPGSGKSCESLGFIEQAFAERDKARVDPSKADEKLSHLKQAIILVKGPTQKSEVRNQLVCRCSNGHFETPNVRKARSEVAQKAAITAEIKDAGYTIMTYTTFARRILNKYPEDDEGLNDQLIAEDYADTIFWIDEAHNLLVDAFTGIKIREKQQTYQTIWRVLHLAKRSKKILSTATPAINEPQEIGYLMNLILPLNGELPASYDYRNAPANDIRVLFPRLPRNINPKTASREQMATYFVGQIPSSFDFNTATIEDLEPYFRGRVGFVRASDTGTVTRNMGVQQTEKLVIDGIEYESRAILYTSAMSEFQSEAYDRAANGSGRKDDLRGAERQAGNFVFPDGHWGNGITEEERARRRPKYNDSLEDDEIDVQIMDEETEQAETRRAFRRYVTVQNDNYAATEEFAPYLTEIEYINNLSCKFAAIVDTVKNNPGNAFVYGEYVEGSGAIVLGLCFEGMGFERYNETTSMFIGNDVDTVKPYCGSSGNGRRQINPNFKKKVRYALLTRKTSDAKFQSMMELFNSYENRHGEYIKVLIASRVGRDGINVNNGMQAHLVGSEWNQSAMYQALSRIFRATGHEDLLEEERQRLIAAGGDPADARITVDVYRHAAVSDEGQSVDVEMYLLSEFKHRAISRIMRILKQCSIGCQTHYNRNVRDSDVDYSADCDYDLCHYQCVDPIPTTIDYSTYDVLYANEVIDSLTDKILSIFRQYNALDIDSLCDLLETNRKYVIMALEYLIVNKHPIIDGFGYKTYLREDHGYFYLDKVYPVGDNTAFPMSYYTNGLIAIESNPLGSVITEIATEDNIEVSRKLRSLDVESPEFISIINDLSLEAKTILLEQACLDYLAGDNSPYVNKIMEIFHGVLFYIHEPVTQLEKALNAATNPVAKRGRRPLAKNAGKPIKKLEGFERETNTEMVYVHIMDSLAEQITKYNEVSRANKAEGKISILKPSEKIGWRELTPGYEWQIYNAYIRSEIAERKEQFADKFPVHGTMINGKFRIVDKIHEAKTASKDTRGARRGRICKDMDTMEIIDVCYNIGMTLPPGQVQRKISEAEKPALVNALVNSGLKKLYTRDDIQSWDMNRISYYINFRDAHITRTQMCERIKDYMFDTGRIMQ